MSRFFSPLRRGFPLAQTLGRRGRAPAAVAGYPTVAPVAPLPLAPVVAPTATAAIAAAAAAALAAMALAEVGPPRFFHPLLRMYLAASRSANAGA